MLAFFHTHVLPGLDPAEPNYKDEATVIRLDKDDAEFVDVIHTNGAPFSSGNRLHLHCLTHNKNMYVKVWSEQNLIAI